MDILKILIHDYSGHPFQVQLSRELAKRGHKVLHLYSKDFNTPHGNLQKQTTDPPTFDIKGLSIGENLIKYSYFKRFFQEIKYKNLLKREIAEFYPDIVIAANTPRFALMALPRLSRQLKFKFIFWIQDIWGMASMRILGNKFGFPGRLMAQYIISIEKNCFSRSFANIAITSDFFSVFEKWKAENPNNYVIENWSPLNEVPLKEKKNPWQTENNPMEKFHFLYSGTMGLKHRPELLVKLAREFASENVLITVITEGPGGEYIQKAIKNEKLKNIQVLPFQPFEKLPEVQASADVLVAVLEKDAGIFSVPSKVLTYHCSGRAMLFSFPKVNLASRIVRENHTGLIADCDDDETFLRHARTLFSDERLRNEMAQNARSYAERTFDIQSITDRFESVWN